MSTWTWTAGLTGLALVGAAVAPGLTPPTPGPVAPPAPLAAVSPSTSTGSGPVAVSMALDKGAVLRGQPQTRFLTVRLDPGAEGAVATRRPLDLAVVLDRSGSMAGDGKWDAAQAAAHDLVRQLAPDDHLTLLTFADGVETLLHRATGSQLDTAHRAIDRAFPTGGTNLHGGLAAAQRAVAGSTALSRVMLLSDGRPTSGDTRPDAIARVAAESQAAGVSVTALGLGLDFNEDLMSRIADAGGGSYAFVDAATDLGAVFEAELDRAGRLVAQQTSIDLHFGPGVRVEEVIGWEHVATAEGVRVGVGDLYAGESRRLVVKLTVTGEGEATMPVADATVAYAAAVDEAQHVATSGFVAEVTERTEIVEASLDGEASQSAYRAWGNALLDKAARSFSRGENDVAQALARDARANIAEVRSLEALGYLDDDAIQAEEEAIEAQLDVYATAAPASTEGKRAIKAAKEKSRAGTR